MYKRLLATNTILITLASLLIFSDPFLSSIRHKLVAFLSPVKNDVLLSRPYVSNGTI